MRFTHTIIIHNIYVRAKQIECVAHVKSINDAPENYSRPRAGRNLINKISMRAKTFIIN